MQMNVEEKRMSGVFYQSSPNILNKSFLNLDYTISARLASQQATGSFCLPPSIELTGVCHHAWWVLLTQAQVPMLAQ